MSYDDIAYVRQKMYRKHRQKMPFVPRSRKEAIEQLKSMDILTNNKVKFCHVFDDIVILTCRTNLQYLIKHGKIILADGTFYCTSNHFSQLYTIHSYNGGVYRQLIYCFLPNKIGACYSKMCIFMI